MSNYIDYVKWRGDLSFDKVEMNEVDITMFSMFPLIDLSSALSSDEVETLKEVYEEYVSTGKRKESLGLIIPDEVVDLLEVCAHSERFSSVLFKDYVRTIDKYNVSQFAALTAETDKVRIIAFSGTDDTVVGWEENFTMMTRRSVPAQRLAIDYLASKIKNDKINYVIGHSKGGNLAMYSYVHSEKGIKDLIKQVYSLDGPGSMFEDWSDKTDGKIIEIVPQDATIGRVFNHYGKFKVVHSIHKGINQHDAFSWQVDKDGYVLDSETKECEIVERTMRELICSLDENQRLDFVDSITRILRYAQAHTLTELDKNKSYLLKAYLAENPTRRKFFTQVMLKLFSVKEVRVCIWTGMRENQKRHEEEKRRAIREINVEKKRSLASKTAEKKMQIKEKTARIKIFADKTKDGADKNKETDKLEKTNENITQ